MVLRMPMLPNKVESGERLKSDLNNFSLGREDLS